NSGLALVAAPPNDTLMDGSAPIQKPPTGAATMKAFEIKGGFGLDALTLGERPDPRPGAGQVLLKMRAWSLNYRDLLIVKGLYNPKLRLPLIPLSDGVGEVVAVGDGVSRVKAGDRVAGLFMQGWLDGP